MVAHIKGNVVQGITVSKARLLRGFPLPNEAQFSTISVLVGSLGLLH